MLIGSLAVHVDSAVALWRRAARARTHAVRREEAHGPTFASRMMRWGGVTLLLFIIWHLLNFSVGKVNVTGGRPTTPTTCWSTPSRCGG